MAERLKVDRSSVSNLLRLLELPTEVQKAITKGDLTASHARALLPLGEEEDQIDLLPVDHQRGHERPRHRGLRASEDRSKRTTAGGGRQHGGKNSANRSEQIISLEKDLKLAMGSKVEIKSNAKGRGKLSIHFKNNEEFERIYDMLLGAGGAEVKKAG